MEAAFVAGGSLASASSAQAETNPHSAQTAQVTVLVTTDVRSSTENWDYLNNSHYSNRAGHEIGLTRASILIAPLRDERGEGRELTLDRNHDYQPQTPIGPEC